MTANEGNGVQSPEPALYGDADAVAASEMPLPSLRVLQAAGAIEALKVPKDHGGFKRMWREEDILLASIGAAIGEHFSWNIRIVSEAMAKTRPGTWKALAAYTSATIPADKSALVLSQIDDCYLDLIDRKFLFLRVPATLAAVLPDVEIGKTVLILGWPKSKDAFQMLPWSLGTKRGQTLLPRTLSSDQIQIAMRHYELAMATHANALSTASINISMQIRATWLRLHGREARFIEQALPRKDLL